MIRTDLREPGVRTYDLMTPREVEKLERSYETIQLALRPLLLRRDTIHARDEEFNADIRNLASILRREKVHRGMLPGVYSEAAMEDWMEMQAAHEENLDEEE